MRGSTFRAPSYCRASIIPHARIRPSTYSRRFSARSKWRSGRNRDGPCTMPARSAASPIPKSCTRLPNHPFAAASIPTRFEPNGARFRYCEMIQSLSCRRSIWSARNASTYFQASVRGCGTMRRAACIVIVEAPEIRRRCVMFCTHARRTLGTLTPQWRKKRRSSLATSAFTIQSSGEAT